jgi:hypothetical protein
VIAKALLRLGSPRAIVSIATPMPNPSILKSQAQPPPEPKSRGANRSTKAAGKLKVLPEQPELAIDRNAPGSANDPEESVGTTGESDDADLDDDEPEVRTHSTRWFAVLNGTHRCTTSCRSCLTARQSGTPRS